MMTLSQIGVQVGRRIWMTKEYIVKFIKDDNVTELVLRSHYTCIYGEYSGEGKSEFISAVEEGMADGSIRL